MGYAFPGGPAVLGKVLGEELWGELCAMSGLLSLCSSVPSGGTGSDGMGTRLLICSYLRSEMQGMSGILEDFLLGFTSLPVSRGYHNSLPWATEEYVLPAPGAPGGLTGMQVKASVFRYN